MVGLFVGSASLQAAAMAVDEGWFHRRRGLPRWERIGHPLDTLTVAATYASLLVLPSLFLYFAIFSCVFVTKDELVHAKACSAGEHWLHAVLFVLHPIVFAAAWLAREHTFFIAGQCALTALFAFYQLIYWSLTCK